MKLKNNSVIGLLTNLRWDWLKLYFFPKVKSEFHDKGGKGGKPKSGF